MGFEAPHVDSDYDLAVNISLALTENDLDFSDLETNLTAHYIFNFDEQNLTYSIESLEMHLQNKLE